MSIPTINSRSDTGKVFLDDQKIRYVVNAVEVLQIDIAAIRVIGEYTTIHALHKNEWFLVLVLAGEEMFQISMYAEGMNEVLTHLSNTLHSDFALLLEDERAFKSNVIWPEKLAGKELYELKIIESKKWFDRFRVRMGFGNPVELVLRDEVRLELG